MQPRTKIKLNLFLCSNSNALLGFTDYSITNTREPSGGDICCPVESSHYIPVSGVVLLLP